MITEHKVKQGKTQTKPSKTVYKSLKDENVCLDLTFSKLVWRLHYE